MRAQAKRFSDFDRVKVLGIILEDSLCSFGKSGRWQEKYAAPHPQLHLNLKKCVNYRTSFVYLAIKVPKIRIAPRIKNKLKSLIISMRYKPGVKLGTASLSLWINSAG